MLGIWWMASLVERALHELARHSVDLEFGGQSRRLAAEIAAHPVVPGVQFFARIAVIQRQHRHRVRNLFELRQRLAADPPGGRGRALQLRTFLLEVTEFGKQPVVLEVGDRGLGEDVVAVVVLSNQPPELGRAAVGLR